MWIITVNNHPFGMFSTNSAYGMKLSNRKEIAESMGFHVPSDECSHTFRKGNITVKLLWGGDQFIVYDGNKIQGEYPEPPALAESDYTDVEELIWAFQEKSI